MRYGRIDLFRLALEEERSKPLKYSKLVMINNFLKLLDLCPMEDIEPREKAKWITTEEPSRRMRCSNCGYVVKSSTPYCAICGSEMEKH